MKNLFLFPFTLIMMVAFNLTATDLASLDATTGCHVTANFYRPTSNASYPAGSDVYVKVNVTNQHKVKFVKLYLNGQYIRTESYAPYEWAKNNSNGDQQLRTMNPGNYQLKAKVYTKCGNYIQITRNFRIYGHVPVCQFNNPLTDLPWLSQLNNQYNLKVCQYRKHGKVYFKVIKCGHNRIYWYDCFGTKQCDYASSSSHPFTSGMQRIRCWDECHNGGGECACRWQAQWVYPKVQDFWYGEEIYVRVHPVYHPDIQWMKLYIDGQFVRKESHYPYEWAKPNSSGDEIVRYPRVGYHTLKVEWLDKCGEKHQMERQIRVKRNI